MYLPIDETKDDFWLVPDIVSIYCVHFKKNMVSDATNQKAENSRIYHRRFDGLYHSTGLEAVLIRNCR